MIERENKYYFDCFRWSGSYCFIEKKRKICPDCYFKNLYFDSKVKNYPYRNQSWVLLSIYPQTVINWFITALSQPPGPFAQINNTTTVLHCQKSIKGGGFQRKKYYDMFRCIVISGKNFVRVLVSWKISPRHTRVLFGIVRHVVMSENYILYRVFFQPAYFSTWL